MRYFKHTRVFSLKNVEKEQISSLLNKKSDDFKEFSALEEISLKYENERKEESTSCSFRNFYNS